MALIERRGRLVTALATAFATELLVSASARAEPTLFAEKPTAVLVGIAPFGSPMGMLSVEAERGLIPVLALGGGVGFGAAGPQGALGLRFRPLQTGAWAIGPAASVSYGKYAPFCSLGHICAQPSGKLLWLNLEVAADLRVTSGLTARFALGFSVDQACWGPRCEAPESSTQESLGRGQVVLPYASAAVGYAF